MYCISPLVDAGYKPLRYLHLDIWDTVEFGQVVMLHFWWPSFTILCLMYTTPSPFRLITLNYGQCYRLLLSYTYSRRFSPSEEMKTCPSPIR